MDPENATLITGASSGIGRAIAIQLSRHRALLLHGRDPERLEETRSLCHDPERHGLWRCDFADPASIAPSLIPLLDPHRHIEVFVHCAGFATVLPARSVDHRTALASLNVNFLSAVETLNVLLKKKVNAQQLTTVVLISSIYSRTGARAHATYSASKAALDGWMRSLAVELAPAIRVNSILPGAIATPIAADSLADPEIAENLRRDYPLGIGRADDIAATVEFLLSSAARWITGQELVVDGGRTVNMSLK
jgi:NAD(P)-dependent dehydrogenase (short-subunit alcohol dehydrogenase family)